MGKKLTIAFLASIFVHKIAHEIFLGINKELKKSDINLMTLIGGSLNHIKKNGADATSNTVYQLGKSNRFDGIIIFGGSIGQFVDDSQMIEFCKNFGSIPVVNISLKLANIPSVISSNYTSMYEIVNHLIKVHKYKKIAFIKGPESHGEALERLSGYKKSLFDNGIEIDENYIFPGNFSQYSGLQAVDLIFKKEKQLKIDAIVCVDDETALGVIYGLKNRGISIPDDIAVVGFDDAEIGANISPGLTTVRQSLDDLGKESVKMLIDIINGNSHEQFKTIPSQVVIRESCGCIPALGFSEPKKEIIDEIKDLSNYSKENIVSKLYNKFSELLNENIIDQIIEAFHYSLSSGNNTKLLKLFTNLLNEQKDNYQNKFKTVNCVIDYLEILITNETEYTIKEVKIVINELRLKNYEYFYKKNVLKKINIENQLFSISQINQNLHRALSFDELFNESYKQFKMFGIKSCFIVLFNNLKTLSDGARLVFGYNSNGRIAIEKEGIQFNPLEIIPEDIFLKNLSDKIIVPLSLDENALGYIVFEIEEEKAELTTALCWHYSSIVQRILILEEEEKKTKELVKTLDELKKAQKKLIEAERYASLGNLVSGVAHEINTPLGIGITYASLIEEKAVELLEFLKNEELTKKKLEDNIISILTAAKGTLLNEKKAAKLIRSFKKLAVNSSGYKVKKILLKDLIDSVVLNTSYKLNKIKFSHKIHVNCPEDIIMFSYPGSISQLLINLIDNSILHGLSDEVPGNIYINIKRENDHINLSYIDDGNGIPEEIIDKVFEPFFTTKRSKGAIGLGLNTVYNTVTQLLKGSLNIDRTTKNFKLNINIPINIKEN